MENIIYLNNYIKTKRENNLNINNKYVRIFKILIEKEIFDIKFILKNISHNDTYYWKNVLKTLKKIEKKIEKNNFNFDNFELDVLFGVIECCLSLNTKVALDIYKGLTKKDIEMLIKLYNKNITLIKKNNVENILI